MTAQESKPGIVIIGAGATGRGHIGQLAHDGGFAVTFIDIKPGLVERLRSSGKYKIGLAGEKIVEIEVSGFNVLHTDQVDECAEAIANADIVATAVIPTNLRSTVSTLSAGIELRRTLSIDKPLNIIACENMERSSTTLRRYLKEDAAWLNWDWIDTYVGFPDSMVARAVPVPKENPLYLISEATQEWSVDATGIIDPMPHLEGMTLSPNQTAALERKLYIKNTGHMAIGVYGFLSGYTLMDQAARDSRIFDLVDAATRESAAAVIKKHGFDPRFTEDYRAGFLEAMRSPFLPDEIIRVVREPMRKLGREERLVGPAMLCCDQGDSPCALAHVISKTMRLEVPGDTDSAELRDRLTTQGMDAVLESVCEIPVAHPLAQLIRREYSTG